MKQSLDEAAYCYATNKTEFRRDVLKEVNSDNYVTRHSDCRKDFLAGAQWQTKQPPWISVKEQLPIPVIEIIDGNEYGSIDVLGAIQNSYGDYDYYICRYWGYNKEYRWENEIAPDYWMYIPKFN